LRERSCAQRPLSSVKHGGSPCSDFLSCLKSSMAFACAQGGIRCSRQLSRSNSKVSADEGCFQALNLSTHRSIIGRSTAQHIIRTVVLIHLGVISSVALRSEQEPKTGLSSRCLLERSLVFPTHRPSPERIKAERWGVSSSVLERSGLWSRIACGRAFRVGCAMAGAKAQSLSVRLRPD
jgi:hypothetical protein